MLKEEDLWNRVVSIVNNYNEPIITDTYCNKFKNDIAIIAKFFNGANIPWFVSGGPSIDLYINKVIRYHDDIDISIYRKDIAEWYEYFEETEHTLTRDGKPIDLINSNNFHTLWLINERKEPPLNNIEIMLLDSNKQGVEFLKDTTLTFTEYNSAPSVTLNNQHIFLTPPIVTIMHKIGNGRLKDYRDIINGLKSLDEKTYQTLLSYVDRVFNTFILTETGKSISFEKLLTQKFNLPCARKLLFNVKELKEKLQKTTEGLRDLDEESEIYNILKSRVEQRIKSVRLWKAVYKNLLA